MATLNQVVDALKAQFPDLDATGLEQTLAQRITGFVVSTAFEDQDHEQRQELLWRALDEALKPEDQRNVGPIVTMTRDEAFVHRLDD